MGIVQSNANTTNSGFIGNLQENGITYEYSSYEFAKWRGRACPDRTGTEDMVTARALPMNSQTADHGDLPVG